MSNVRIRYLETQPGKLLSRRIFTTGQNQEVKVELDILSKEYRILDVISNNEISKGGDTINLAVLKIKAKKALEDLGVIFSEEVRNREDDQEGPLA